MEKQTMWAVFTPNGELMWNTIEEKRWFSINLNWLHHEWKKAYSKGYRCKKVDIVMTKDEITITKI
jgi:hypothetical protein